MLLVFILIFQFFNHENHLIAWLRCIKCLLLLHMDSLHLHNHVREPSWLLTWMRQVLELKFNEYICLMFGFDLVVYLVFYHPFLLMMVWCFVKTIFTEPAAVPTQVTFYHSNFYRSHLSLRFMTLHVLLA